MRNSFKFKTWLTHTISIFMVFSLSGCIFYEVVDVPVSTQESPAAPPQESTPQEASSAVPLESAAEIVPSLMPTPLVLDGNLVWKADFETGNISEIEEVGDFYFQGSGRYDVVTPHAHSGNYSVALTIDSLAPTDTGSHASYLFRTRSDLLPDDGYYYSAWYYIPQLVKPDVYWNIMQWKSTREGNTPQPMYMIDVDDSEPNKLFLYLAYLPNREDVRKFYHQKIVDVPIEQWFHIEAYYKRAQDNTGQIQIWQDGIEIFNITDTATVLSDNTIHWSVNSYSSGLAPAPLTLYVDDMAISKTRLGQTLD